MTIVVYIGGYGHCGTTLLEYLVTGSPVVIACGEVGVPEARESRENKSAPVACRPSIARSGVLSSRSHTDSIQLAHEDIVLSLRQQISSRYGLMVDSSKTAWRNAFSPFRLRPAWSRFCACSCDAGSAGGLLVNDQEEGTHGTASKQRPSLRADDAGLVTSQSRVRVVPGHLSGAVSSRGSIFAFATRIWFAPPARHSQRSFTDLRPERTGASRVLMRTATGINSSGIACENSTCR
jgi:hypothetical protein